jgi:hypothetical protein
VIGAARDIDLLFVVGNSPSMGEEQASLTRAFPALVAELKKAPGGLPNLHIAVVSSDLGAGPTAVKGCIPIGDRGRFQTKASCGLDAGARFMSSVGNGTANNFRGEIADVFKCMASLGVQGCGYIHPLQSVRAALLESVNPENKGFLRPNALLAIVLVADEDDCSADLNSKLFSDTTTFLGTTPTFRCAQEGHLCAGMSPPIDAFQAPLSSCKANDAGRLETIQAVVDTIRVMKKDPARQIFVAGVFGWPSDEAGAQYRYVKTVDGAFFTIDVAPICQSQNGPARSGLRLKRFVESFEAGAWFSVCQDDLGPPLRQIGQRLATMARQ